jgi:hypothetical protein
MSMAASALAVVSDTGLLLSVSSRVESAVDDLDCAFCDVTRSFFRIGRCLSLLDDKDVLAYLGKKDVYQFAKDRYNLGRTSTKNYLGVYRIFKNAKGELDEKFSDVGFSSLVELLPVADDKEFAKTVSKLDAADIRILKREWMDPKGDKVKEKFVADVLSSVSSQLKSYKVKASLDGKPDFTEDYSIGFHVGKYSFALAFESDSVSLSCFGDGYFSKDFAFKSLDSSVFAKAVADHYLELLSASKASKKSKADSDDDQETDQGTDQSKRDAAVRAFASGYIEDASHWKLLGSLLGSLQLDVYALVLPDGQSSDKVFRVVRMSGKTDDGKPASWFCDDELQILYGRDEDAFIPVLEKFFPVPKP